MNIVMNVVMNIVMNVAMNVVMNVVMNIVMNVIIIIIFHSQDLLSRDVLLMFPSLRRYHHNLQFCNMGVPWDVP